MAIKRIHKSEKIHSKCDFTMWEFLSFGFPPKRAVQAAHTVESRAAVEGTFKQQNRFFAEAPWQHLTQICVAHWNCFSYFCFSLLIVGPQRGRFPSQKSWKRAQKLAVNQTKLSVWTFGFMRAPRGVRGLSSYQIESQLKRRSPTRVDVVLRMLGEPSNSRFDHQPRVLSRLLGPWFRRRRAWAQEK